MNRYFNIIAQIDDVPPNKRCPDCGCVNTKPAADEQLERQVGRWVIDIYQGKWLQCVECGTCWKPQTEPEMKDENR